METLNSISDISVTTEEVIAAINMRVQSVTIESFGAAGNGITDDTLAFQAFNTWALIQPEGVITLNLSRGKVYLYTDNTFAFNIRKLVINGNDSELRNISTWQFDRAFGTAAGMSKRSAKGEVPVDVDYYLIQNAGKGANAIILKTPSQHTSFSVGEWVMVGAHDIFPIGFPSSFKKFDYARITAKNPTTGQLTLDRNLSYNYKDNDIYNSSINTTSTGKASVYKIEQGSAWGIKHVYNDVYFNTPAQSDKSADYVSGIGEEITFNRCKGYAFNPTVAGKVTYNQCISLGAAEFDKLVNKVIDNGSYWIELSSGVSIKSVEFNSSRIKDVAGLSPHELIFRNCVIDGIFNVGNRGQVDNLMIDGGEIAQKDYEMFSLGSAQVLQVKIGTGGVTYSSGILSVPVTDENMRGFLRNVQEGTIIHISAEVDGSSAPSYKFGQVSAVTCNGVSALIAVGFNFAIGGSEKLVIFDEPKTTKIQGAKMRGIITNRDHAVIGKKFVLKDYIPAIVNGNTPYLVYYTPNFSGYPRRIRINVKKAYTGNAVGGNVVLVLKRYNPNYGDIVTIDMKTRGRRELTRYGNFGFTGSGGESGGYNLEANDASYVSVLQIGLDYNFFADTVDKMPILDIEMEFD